MKKLIIALFLLCSIAACKKSDINACATCRHYGGSDTAGVLLPYMSQICYKNKCTCPMGLEGDSCQKYSIDKYLQPSPGWSVTDGCTGSAPYIVSISNAPGYPYTSFRIIGLFQSGTSIQADLLFTPDNPGSEFNILPQGSIVQGQGYYTAIGSVREITLNLDYINTSGLDVPCTLHLTQQ